MAQIPQTPDRHDEPRTPGGNNLNNIAEGDVDRVVPRAGEALERDETIEPDEIGKAPDDSGSRPKPL